MIAVARTSSPNVSAHSVIALLLVMIVDAGVAAVDDLEETVRVGAIERQVAGFIDREQVWALQLGELAG